jgi:hypothetical protein
MNNVVLTLTLTWLPVQVWHQPVARQQEAQGTAGGLLQEEPPGRPHVLRQQQRQGRQARLPARRVW